MGISESEPRGNEDVPQLCQYAALCIRGLFDRAATLASEGKSLEMDPALLSGLNEAVIDGDDNEGFYVLACQAAQCEEKYAVGRTIEPQKL